MRQRFFLFSDRVYQPTGYDTNEHGRVFFQGKSGKYFIKIARENPHPPSSPPRRRP